MPLISCNAFASACRSADREAITGLIADLYDARSRSVDRRGDGRLRLVAPDGTTQDVVISDGSQPVPADVDILVNVGRQAHTAVDGRVVQIAELHQKLCYSVEPETGARILRECLGISVSSLSTHSEDNGDGENTSSAEVTTEENLPLPAAADTGTPRYRKLIATVISAGIFFLAVLTLASLAPVGGESQVASTPETPDEVVTATATPAPETGVQGERSDTVSSSRTEWVPSRQWPPGVNQTSVNQSQLLAAHALILKNTSYTVTLTYREFRDNDVHAGYAETVKISADSRAGVTVNTFGSRETEPWRLLGEQWNTMRRVQHSDTLSVVTHDNMDRYFRRALSANNTRLVDHTVASGVTTARVSLRSSRDPTVRNASGNVFVTQDGLVQFLRWEFDHTGDTRIAVTIRVSAVGETNVSGPPRGVDLSG